MVKLLLLMGMGLGVLSFIYSFVQNECLNSGMWNLASKLQTSLYCAVHNILNCLGVDRQCDRWTNQWRTQDFVMEGVSQGPKRRVARPKNEDGVFGKAQ